MHSIPFEELESKKRWLKRVPGVVSKWGGDKKTMYFKKLVH